MFVEPDASVLCKPYNLDCEEHDYCHAGREIDIACRRLKSRRLSCQRDKSRIVAEQNVYEQRGYKGEVFVTGVFAHYSLKEAVKLLDAKFDHILKP